MRRRIERPRSFDAPMLAVTFALVLISFTLAPGRGDDSDAQHRSTSRCRSVL